VSPRVQSYVISLYDSVIKTVSLYILVTILTTGVISALVCAHFVYFVLSNLSLLHACAAQVFFDTCMRGFRGVLDVGSFSSCPWSALVASVESYVLAGVEIGLLSCTCLYFCRC